MSDVERLREALAQIADIAAAATGHMHSSVETSEGEDMSHMSSKDRVCSPKALPTGLLVAAAKTAVDINPVNAPMMGPLAAAGLASDQVMDPMRIAVLSRSIGALSRESSRSA